jgi:hypothetical protein
MAREKLSLARAGKSAGARSAASKNAMAFFMLYLRLDYSELEPEFKCPWKKQQDCQATHKKQLKVFCNSLRCGNAYEQRDFVYNPQFSFS